MTSPQQPEGPQSPAPGGPQSPGPQSPPQSPPPQQSGGPVPPGGWQQAPPPVVSGQLASWGSRVGAYVIDGLIILIPSFILLAIIGGGLFATGDDGGGFFALVGAAILTIFVIVIVSLLYAPLLMMRQGQRNGQTIGKQLLDIRAVRDNGQQWSFGSAALREVVMKNLAVGIASSVIPILPWFLNFFWPLWDDQNRALHDMAVSSHVVRT